MQQETTTHSDPATNAQKFRKPSLRIYVAVFAVMFLFGLTDHWKDLPFEYNCARSFFSAVGWLIIFWVWNQIDDYLFDKLPRKM